ncbi:uncharacterized protein LOC133334624 [Musca vetustissima]|uniref:uncharacterized protein LOC133334624 n=1 Tax=Musca vetustissima TaxID=27455 RepID=UPI002AB78B5A|nr:uncharacterized protein LOC133334624 [Musca vetustissima]
MQQLAKALLLVGLLAATAHAKTIVLAKDNVTSQLPLHGGAKGDDGPESVTATAASVAENLDDKTVDSSTLSSAVEDWSLVCQQLCGAALGGAVCSPYCKIMPVLPTKVQIENANTLMHSKKQFICPQLCGLQLGDGVCTCKNSTSEHQNFHQIKTKVEMNVCSIFCDVRHVTLAGSINLTSDQREVVNIAPIADVTTTTTTVTTPNWNELCAALCKTGDGGSLCNCDLSPFSG